MKHIIGNHKYQDEISISKALSLITPEEVWIELNLAGVPKKSCKSPFRDDRKPSFSVFQGREGIWFFKDHATGDGGNMITLWAEAKGIDSKTACREFMAFAKWKLGRG
jgi:hypothetical protein